MALISLHDISLGYGSGLLLDGADLTVEKGDRACLVGRNGTGKSTLLKLLAGQVTPDSGDIRKSTDTRISYMAQTVPHDIDTSVGDIVADGLRPFGIDIPDWNEDRRVGRVLSHVDLNGYDAFSELSGGQKRRALLAAALVAEPDLLLLDEPTNHLDIESILWMENFLKRQCPTVLFVTHDRALARSLANRVLDLDRGRLSSWTCDYDTYLRRKDEQLHEEEVRNAAFDKKLAKEEAWIRQGIKARRTRNEGRVRALEQMRRERSQRRERQGQARIQVQQAERSGQKVIHAKDVSFGYDSTPVIRNLETEIMRKDRIGIVGPNGSGKTTLIKVLTGGLTPDTGSIKTGTNLEIAYFDQHRSTLNDSLSVAENVNHGNDTVTINGKSRHVMSYLQDFLFTPDRARSPVSILSGGERNRLLIARLFAIPSNVLIMDEPTNDLDMETLDLLEEQLLEYDGTILIVSHDRDFLDNVTTSLLVIQKDGTVKEVVGAYSDWLASQKATTPPPQTASNTPTKAKTKRLGFNENRELKALPGKIEKLETEQTELHTRMSDPDYFKSDPETQKKESTRLSEIEDELLELYSRWEELETLKNSS